jgi:hypothetical protein
MIQANFGDEIQLDPVAKLTLEFPGASAIFSLNRKKSEQNLTVQVLFKGKYNPAHSLQKQMVLTTTKTTALGKREVLDLWRAEPEKSQPD